MNLKKLHGRVYLADTERDGAEFTQRLGGIVKVAGVCRKSAQFDADHVVSCISQAGKVVFGITSYAGGDVVSPALYHEVKNLLKSQGISSRFVSSTDGKELSSVVVQKQSVQEIIVCRDGDDYVYAVVESVQDFEAWNTRDYRRPHADPKAGMLPPKTARMAVNIACGEHTEGKVVYDPFCGMGTVLAEALMVGATVVGTDLDAPSVTKAQENLAWLCQEYSIPSSRIGKMSQSDATHVSDVLEERSVDVIVTEPYMGPTAIGGRDQDFSAKKLKNIMTGLEKLYIGALKDWRKILKPDGVVLMALPRYDINGRTYFVKRVIDSCEKFDYTNSQGPIEYSRPQADVRREFYLFTLGVT